MPWEKAFCYNATQSSQSNVICRPGPGSTRDGANLSTRKHTDLPWDLSGSSFLRNGEDAYMARGCLKLFVFCCCSCCCSCCFFGFTINSFWLKLRAKLNRQQPFFLKFIYLLNRVAEANSFCRQCKFQSFRVPDPTLVLGLPLGYWTGTKIG